METSFEYKVKYIRHELRRIYNAVVAMELRTDTTRYILNWMYPVRHRIQIEVDNDFINRLRCENIVGIIISKIDRDIVKMFKNDEEDAL